MRTLDNRVAAGFRLLCLIGFSFLLACVTACSGSVTPLSSDVLTDATTPDGAPVPADGNAVADASSSNAPDACSMCNGQCLDFTTDHGNCGKCGNACLTSEVCQGGECACAPGQLLCGPSALPSSDAGVQATASCVDPMSDPGNCGRCGNACIAGSGCQGGACVCLGAETLCGSGANLTCAVLSNDHDHCGACTTTCAAGGSCQDGACVCPSGQQTCGSGAAAACVDLSSDRSNCGGCGTACASDETCVNSQCVQCATIMPIGTGIMCGTPAMCVDKATDRNNCGTCGDRCLTSQICQNGSCACPSGEVLCGSGANQSCVTLSSDQNNCGKCGAACGGGMVCKASTCVCPTGFHSCGGTCVPDTSTSTSSCGTSCAVCPIPSGGGSATCAGTPPACGQNCGGARPTLCNRGANASCVNTTNDPSNCGGCGMGCNTTHAQASCLNSRCNVTCTAGFANCDGNVANGCEIDTSNDKNNCGSCGHICPSGSCAGGVCTPCNSGQMACNGKCVSCPAAPTNGTLICSGANCVASCNNASLPQLCGSGNAAACVNTQTDNSNCGGCNMPCSQSTAPDKCDQTYSCQGGSCQGSDPITCPPSPNAPCQIAACQPGSGKCASTNAPNGTTCDDGNPCTQKDQCTGGMCGGTQITCTPSDVCHTAACDTTSGMCVNSPKDGAACDGDGMCSGGTCQCPGSQVMCPSGATVTCVDTTDDPNNCGMCGKVCTVPAEGGTPTCFVGVCIP
jgi:hypothetical protein